MCGLSRRVEKSSARGCSPLPGGSSKRTPNPSSSSVPTPRPCRPAASGAPGALEGERPDEHPYDASTIGSTDGGYVLLGMGGPHEELFRDVPWSTEAVYHKTVQGARALGLSLHEGEPHYDVDTPQDLVRLEEELGANPHAAPHTAKFLKDLRTQKGRGPKESAPRTDD